MPHSLATLTQHASDTAIRAQHQNAAVHNPQYETTSGLSTLGTTVHSSELTALEAPGEGASPEEHKQFLQYQLDTLKGLEVVEGLVFDAGPFSRTCGDSCVQRLLRCFLRVKV